MEVVYNKSENQIHLLVLYWRKWRKAVENKVENSSSQYLAHIEHNDVLSLLGGHLEEHIWEVIFHFLRRAVLVTANPTLKTHVNLHF